jgi:hypothetical protein
MYYLRALLEYDVPASEDAVSLEAWTVRGASRAWEPGQPVWEIYEAAEYALVPAFVQTFWDCAEALSQAEKPTALHDDELAVW